jgi:hypothetical protein
MVPSRFADMVRVVASLGQSRRQRHSSDGAQSRTRASTEELTGCSFADRYIRPICVATGKSTSRQERASENWPNFGIQRQCNIFSKI